MTYDLSVCIPARNEAFLKNTIDDILANRRAKTEVICVLDGTWPSEPIPDHPDVTLIYHPESIGQRAACNEAARVSSARYVMKVDAHCAFDEGFDVKLMEDMQDDWTVVPIMRNLHVFDWVCQQCGARRYQSPTPTNCPACDNTRDFVREIVWIAKPSPQSKSFCFDSTPHFQYFFEYSKRPEGQGDLTETMSLQGSCFMMTREKYFELGVCDESLGMWGSQGIEVACKTWLSGGGVMVNHKTWYAHCFRTQGGDFSFPYPLPQSQVNKAREQARALFFENRWEKQIHPLSWLIEKFWPVPGWSDEDLAQLKKKKVSGSSKGIIYYTDNRLDPAILTACQRQIAQSINGHEVVSVSLKPLNFGRNIALEKERGYLTMFEQILAGLEASTADVIFFCEHDVLYHPSHFEFIPSRRDVFYYNENCWKVDAQTGKALFYYARQTSGLVAYRELLLEHYHKRVEIVRERGYDRRIGFEPGTHNRKERIDDYRAEGFMSACPNIDIRHTQNLTPSRWRKEQFRDQRYTRGWTEADEIPGWGTTQQILSGIKETL